MASPGSRLFENLPARPPTPPRDGCIDVEEGLDDAVAFLNSGFEIEEMSAESISTKNQFLETPDQTPVSSSGNLAMSSTGTKNKRVDFAPFTSWGFHNSPGYFNKDVSNTPVKPLPPSRERQSTRSILKPFRQAIVTATAPSTATYESFPEMLEATIHQLAGTDRSSRVDAYIGCVAAMQAFESLPNPLLLKEKAPQLLTFIERDIKASKSTPDVPDSQLIVAALKLLACLLRLPEIAYSLEVDTCSSIIDNSILVLQDPKTPKGLAYSHLLVLCQQKLSIKVVTPERTNRLLSALHKIHERVKGSGPYAYRLLIYRRLCEQVPTVMLAKLPDWVQHVYHSMLSSKAELRQQALELGLASAIRFGSDSEVSRGLHELFTRECDEKPYREFVIERLTAMLKDKDMGPVVPRAWTITVLFLRGRKHRNSHYSDLKPWFVLIQRCLNSTDRQIRVESNIAWNRFISSVNLDVTSSPQIRGLLRAPIETQLGQQRDGEFSKGIGRVVLSSYVCLLYYGLRLGASDQQLDIYWSEYVDQILAKFVGKTKHHAYYACSILQSLCQASEKWSEARPFEDPLILDIDELPQLSSKWIRANLSKVLQVLAPFLSSRMSWQPLDVENPNDSQMTDPPALSAWKAILSAVRDAGTKEITASTDLKSAIAHITNTLHRTWLSLKQNRDSNSDATSVFSSLIESVLNELGPANLTEKILARTSGDDFEAAPTPSHRPKAGGSLQSPIIHLLGLLLAPNFSPPSKTSANSQFIRSTILRCWESRNSRRYRLELLGDFAQSLDLALKSGTSGQLLNELAEHTIELTEATLTEGRGTITSSTAEIAHDFADVLRVLRYTLFARNSIDPPVGVYRTLVESAKQTGGDGALLLAVTEPHAEMIMECMANGGQQNEGLLLNYAAMVLDHDARPRNRGAVERGRRALWGGVSPVSNSMANFHVEHTKLAAMANQALQFAYSKLNDGNGNTVIHFLDTVTQYIKRTPTTCCIVFLREIQDGLTVFLLDISKKVKQYASKDGGKGILSATRSQWQTAISVLRLLPRMDEMNLQAFDDLITAGLMSPRQALANITIVFWNDTFGKVESLKYSHDLSDALQRLTLVVDISMFGQVSTSNENSLLSPLSVVSYDESVDSDSDEKEIRKLLPNHSGPHIAIQPHLQPATNQSVSPARSMKSSPFKQTPKARLRHNDSQIQFEAIESSPLAQDQHSQVLTGRQKEVAERQKKSAAAMFPDIRSSPSLKRNPDIGSSAPLVIDSDIAVVSSDAAEVQVTTPILAPIHDLGDDDIPSSSPIAASVSRRQNVSSRCASQSDHLVDADDHDIPSSPPEVPRRAKFATTDATRVEASEFPNAISPEPCRSSSIDPALPAAQLVAELGLGAGKDTQEQDHQEDEENRHVEKSPEAEAPTSGTTVENAAQNEDGNGSNATKPIRGSQRAAAGTDTVIPGTDPRESSKELAKSSSTKRNLNGNSSQGDETNSQSSSVVQESFILPRIITRHSGSQDMRSFATEDIRSPSQSSQGSQTCASTKRRRGQFQFGRPSKRSKTESWFPKPPTSTAGMFASEGALESITIKPKKGHGASRTVKGRLRTTINANPSPENSQDMEESGSLTESQEPLQDGISNSNKNSESLDDVSPAERRRSGRLGDDEEPLRTLENVPKRVLRSKRPSQSPVGTGSGIREEEQEEPAAKKAKVENGKEKKKKTTTTTTTSSSVTATVEASSMPGHATPDAVQISPVRMILSPSSIIAKLRSIARDCQQMVFGNQEQREIDDALFEVRKEVFFRRKDT